MTDDDEAADDGGFEPATRRSFIRGVGAMPIATSLWADEGFDDPFVEEREREDGTTDHVRSFTVHAIEVDIVYNQFGIHQPNGAMYVLEENLKAAKAASGVIPDDHFDWLEGESSGDDVDTSVIEPLVIRANKGEVVEIEFHNHLDQPASMHQTGLPQDPKESDGMNVGENPSTIAQPGETVNYTWHATHRGGHFFYDGAHQGYNSPKKPPEEANHLSRGLFGTLVVEPEGATWTDPETGGPLRSGTKADIHDPNFMGTSYREFVPHYHSPSGVYLQDGGEKTWPDNPNNKQTTHAINYRESSTGMRVTNRNGASSEKRLFYSSWVHGDPGGGDNVYPAYKGDPIKFVPVGASLEENHVHHLHNSRWKTVPTRSDSDTIDAQTIGLGASYPSYLIAAHGKSKGSAVHDPEESVRPNMDFKTAFTESGAGYIHGGTGDILFHCHLFPHYAEGMWAYMRVHDKQVPHLQPLPDTRIVSNPDTANLPLDDGILADSTAIPGFPNFVPGTKGKFPPKPVSPNGRSPTKKEKKAGLDTQVAGAPYQDPVVDDDAPVRNHTIHCLQGEQFGDVVYNDEGDYDPEGLLYVHEDDVEAAKNGNLNPEPLFLRANVGEAVNVTVVNETEYPLTIHPHFVAFDPMATDSTPSIGANYEESVEPGQERVFRWYADEEGTIYFHDHTVGTDKAQHGTFAGLIVEPEGSRHLDPYSGEPIDSGAQAIIEVPDGTDFREFAMHYNDFVPLRDKGTGEFVNPQREHNENLGVHAINNRNAPYYHRDGEDPAYVHSSAVHGDPATPLLEAYSNDPIRIRLFQGAWEDQHNFTLNGRQIEPEGLEEQDTVSQIISPSEAFTFFVDPYDAPDKPDFDRLPNPAGLPVQDYMYSSAVVDDRWTGQWGIHRVFDAQVPHLEPLPDRGAPAGKITADQLKAMGHSAPYVGIDRLKTLGQRARLLYENDDNRNLTPDTPDRKNPNVGEKPPKAPDPGDPCPEDARVRKYDVEVHQTEIQFNDHGDHDPNGIVFALDEYADEIVDGERPADPLTLRANKGDCIEVRLKNEMEPGAIDTDHVDPPMRIPKEWDPSDRVSLHPQRITYDPNGSHGATIGFNYDQTIGPGEDITYRWYADDLYDNMVLTDEADVRGHRHHGAFGNLVVEPEDAVWLDNSTAEVLPEGVDAILKHTGTGAGKGQPDVREYALSMSDGRYVINENDPDDCVVPAGPDSKNPNGACNEIGGFEDGGHGAINNRSEPFTRRFDKDPAQWKVYDSDVHGDPATPVLRALLGDPVKFLVHEPADKARGMSFHLSGHQWQRWRGVPESPVIGVDDRISPGKGIRLGLTSDAGGHQQATGDYIFQDTKQRRRLESGLWGIFRVRDNPLDFPDPAQPLPDRDDAPPARRPNWNTLHADITNDGTDDLVVGVPDSDVGAEDGGAVYVFENHTGSLDDLSNADLAFVGSVPGRRIGTSVSVKGNGNSPVISIGTATGPPLTVPAGTPAAEVIANPPATAVRGFLRNTTANGLGAVFRVDDVVQNGYGGGGDGGGSVGTADRDADLDHDHADLSNDELADRATDDVNVASSGGLGSGPMKILQCTECGQSSAPAGEASLWSTDAADTGEAVFECRSCGNRQEGTEL